MSSEDIENQLWKAMKDASNNEIGRKVRIANIADDHLPIPHKEWTTQQVARWNNEGLVVSYRGDTRAALTEKGARIDDLEEAL